MAGHRLAFNSKQTFKLEDINKVIQNEFDSRILYLNTSLHKALNLGSGKSKEKEIYKG